MNVDEKIISWLKDAHPIESGVGKALERNIGQAKGYPELQKRLKRHAAETRRHGSLVERRLKKKGDSPSAVESAAAKALGAAQSAMTSLLGDSLLTNLSANYSLEHLEISTYSTILAAAEETGDRETAALCRAILKEEAAMADDLMALIPKVTARYLGVAAA